eukprot:s2379_g9.t2
MYRHLQEVVALWAFSVLTAQTHTKKKKKNGLLQCASARPRPPEREPEADESRAFAPAGRRPAGRRQLERPGPAATEEAPKRQSSVASDRSRRSGAGGRSQNEGRGFSATISLGSSRQSQTDTGAGGGPLSARRRNGTATMSATTIASKNSSSANGRAASSGTATATRQTRARSQEVTSRRGSTGAEPMVSISQLRRRRRQTESRSRSREGDASARGLFQEPYMRQLRIEDCRAVFRSNKAAIHASKPEIKIVCAQLSQALKAEALDSVVLDLLRRLSVYMHPLRGNRMLEYLRFTGAVPLVKAVRRDCGKEVSGFASRLLDSWRAVLVDLQKQQATDTAGASKPNAECAAASSTSCAARQPQSDGKALLVSRVEAQLESYRTRNAALEGEVAGLRAEAQAVKQGLDAEIERLRRELQSKDPQLHKELEVKKRQLTSLVLPCEQNKALQTILSSCRAIPRESGSVQLPTAVVAFSHAAPAPLTTNSPANMATPRTTPPQVAAPQIYTASPGLQLRQLRGEPTAVSFASSANTVQPFASLAFQRVTPRQDRSSEERSAAYTYRLDPHSHAESPCTPLSLQGNAADVKYGCMTWSTPVGIFQ